MWFSSSNAAHDLGASKPRGNGEDGGEDHAFMSYGRATGNNGKAGEAK
jgi:hypothetical protein